MSDKPTFDAIRADVAELVSQCPSRATHGIAVYLMSKNYRYGIVCAICSLTEDNCNVNVSNDEDELIDYIAKAVVKHWGEPTGGFADGIVMDTFEAAFGSTTGVRAAKHYAEWITTEAYNLCSDDWVIVIGDDGSDSWMVGFAMKEDCNKNIHSPFCLDGKGSAEHFARMLSAISGYQIG